MDQETESNEGQEGTEGLCAECGVPPYMSSQHTWLNNGDIVYANLNTHRITLMEFEFIDLMIKGIEESIGYPIEHIVLTTVQTTMRMYIESLLPREIGEMVKGGTLDLKTVDDGLCEVGRTAGIGVYNRISLNGLQAASPYRMTPQEMIESLHKRNGVQEMVMNNPIPPH